MSFLGLNFLDWFLLVHHVLGSFTPDRRFRLAVNGDPSLDWKFTRVSPNASLDEFVAAAGALANSTMHTTPSSCPRPYRIAKHLQPHAGGAWARAVPAVTKAAARMRRRVRSFIGLWPGLVRRGVREARAAAGAQYATVST